MCRRALISWFDRPAAMRPRTSASRSVSPSGSPGRRRIPGRLLGQCAHHVMVHGRIDHRPPRRHGPHGAGDLVDPGVLRQVAEGACLQGIEDRAVVGIGRQHHDPRVRARLTQALGRLDPVATRHPQVHEDDVGAQPLRPGNGLVPVGSGADHLHGGDQVDERGESVSHDALVVRYQDPDPVRRHQAGTRSSTEEAGRRRTGLETTADELGPLPHPGQPVAALRELGPWPHRPVRSDAHVLHAQRQPDDWWRPGVLRPGSGSGVPGDVRQGFLGHSVHHQAGPRIQLPVVTADRDDAGPAGCLLELFGQPGQVPGGPAAGHGASRSRTAPRRDQPGPTALPA